MTGSRRLLVATLLLGIGIPAAVALLVLRSQGAFRNRPRPHIVVLLWDTTRADHLSVHGYSRRTSPWLEGVAAEGVVFEQCRAPAPWTLPSHASLFTGLLPSVHGAQTFDGKLSQAHETLAESLAAEGYDTILISNNAFVGKRTGLDQGFARVVEILQGPDSGGAVETTEVLRRELTARKNDAERAARPLFLFINLLDPHLPYDPPGGDPIPWRPEGATDDQIANLRRFAFPWEMAHNLGVRKVTQSDIDVLAALYDAELLALDRQCAVMEQLLRAEGILGTAGDTDATAGPGSVLVVTSDHGENLGEHGLLDHKVTLSDAVLRIPLVIRWPGRLPRGHRVEAQVRLQDLHPTLLEAADVRKRPPKHPAAESLLGDNVLSRVAVAEFPEPRSFLPGMQQVMHAEFGDLGPAVFQPLRQGLWTVIGDDPERWKYVRTSITTSSGESLIVGEQLYHLRVDPLESTDLIATPTKETKDEAERTKQSAQPLYGPIPRRD